MSSTSRAAAIALALTALAATSDSALNGGARRDPASGAYLNTDPGYRSNGLGDFLRWRHEAARDGKPAPPRSATPVVAPDLGFIHRNAAAGDAMRPALTWIGHATVLAQFGGFNVLTDPIFSERASPLSFVGPKRAQPPALALGQLPRIDVVIVSHNHYDHLDEASVRALNAQAGGPPLFVVPLGLAAWMKGVGIERVVELDWWQSHRLDGLEIVLTPVQHWSGRGLVDRMQTLWGGYALFTPQLHVYFAGDTGYSKDFVETRERFAERQRDGGGFDVALLPLGAYEPRWFMRGHHIAPDEAVQIHRDLGARRSVAVHWGTFELSDEALDEPPRALAAARAAHGIDAAAFATLTIGQTLELRPRNGLQGGQP